jgi:uncharacterized protein YacL
MLILILRIAFVVLAALVGMTSGSYFYGRFVPGMPAWFGGALGFSVAVTLVAAEQGFRRRFARSVVAFLIGLGAGLAMAALALTVLRQVLQTEELYDNLDLPLALVMIYLVMITVLRNIDRWRVVVPFVEFRSAQAQGGALVLDGPTLGDSRLVGLLRSGLVTERVLVHRRVLTALEQQARAEDPVTRARGARALEGLTELRALLAPRLEIDESDIPNVDRLEDALVRLCRLENARLASNDRELLRRAQAEGVPVVDLAALAAALVPTVRPGEVISVSIEKPGEGKGQGVGFLDDGSMVVVNGAAEQVGKRVRVTVMRMHTSGSGKMVFGELAEAEVGERP